MKGNLFRIKLAIDFAAYLALGMILLLFVIVLFWQYFAVQQAIMDGKRFLQNAQIFVGKECGSLSLGKRHNLPDLEFGRFNFLYNDTLQFLSDDSEEVLAHLRKAAASTTIIVEGIGGRKGVFVPRYGKFLVAKPLVACGQKTVLALEINADKIRSSIWKKVPLFCLYILINVVILTAVWFFRIRRMVLQPLDNLVQISEAYQYNSADILSSLHAKSEFSFVESSLQNMLLRVEKDKKALDRTVASLEQANREIVANQNSLVEAEKFAAIGRMTAGFAHEIGNPIGIIQGYLELLHCNDITSEERRQFTERMQKELDRVSSLIRQLLDYSRKDSDESREADVAGIVQSVVDLLRHQKLPDISIESAIDKNVGIAVCRPSHLEQVIMNCLLNAVDAIREVHAAGGRIRVLVKKLLVDNTKKIEISILDNGTGIAEEEASLLFDPFYTTKPVGKGTGLGLFLSKNMIENAGGDITLHNLPEGGCCVRILLNVV